MAIAENNIVSVTKAVDGIHERLNGLTVGAFALALAIMGWLAVQLYTHVTPPASQDRVAYSQQVLK